jgi:hypothetical protein
VLTSRILATRRFDSDLDRRSNGDSRTRALVRDARRAVGLPDGAEIVIGDLTDAATLGGAAKDVDGIVFTHGSHGGATEAENVDYGAFVARVPLRGFVTHAATSVMASSSRCSDGRTGRHRGPAAGPEWRRSGGSGQLMQVLGLGFVELEGTADRVEDFARGARPVAPFELCVVVHADPGEHRDLFRA